MPQCRLFPVAALLLTILSLALLAAAGPAGAQDFRQMNGLVEHAPPPWFLEGNFVAKETGPRYVFGRVQDFVAALDCPTAWLIEDVELELVKKSAAAGQTPEHTLYLEAQGPGGPVYWVFVALPYQSAQEWYEARRRYHGQSKTEGYYGETRRNLERALNDGVAVKGELRFMIVAGQPSLRAPEEVLATEMGQRPIYDLAAGRRAGEVLR